MRILIAEYEIADKIKFNGLTYVKTGATDLNNKTAWIFQQAKRNDKTLNEIDLNKYEYRLETK